MVEYGIHTHMVESRGERIGDERLPDDFLEKYGEMEDV